MPKHPRNAKCWCGSNLKYKKCCLPEVEPNSKYIFRQAPADSKGTQPVKVLENNILWYFQQTHKDFTIRLKKDIEKADLKPGIKYINEESKIREIAYINSNKQIHLQETFLSYIWIVSYCLMTIFDEHILLPRLKNGVTNDPKRLAYKMDFLRHAVSLISKYTPWDIDYFPNPEKYTFDQKANIEKTNSIFLRAVNFVLCHEYSHFSLGHSDKAIELMIAGRQITDEENKIDEIDADYNAIRLMISTAKTKKIRKNIEYGIISGIASLIFIDKIGKKDNYPDPEIRLKNALENLKLKDDDLHWGLASLALKIWVDFQKESITLPEVVDTYKECFYLIIKEINEIKEGNIGYEPV